jgi:hypothetical protein
MFLVWFVRAVFGDPVLKTLVAHRGADTKQKLNESSILSCFGWLARVVLGGANPEDFDGL